MTTPQTTCNIGWAQADLTPDKPVLLAGQFHARVSEGMLDPVTATVCAIESRAPNSGNGQAIMISCDLATISDELRDAVRTRVRACAADIAPENLFISATHTHSAPDVRVTPYGMGEFGDQYKADLVKSLNQTTSPECHGMWPFLELDILYPPAYMEWAADRIAAAVTAAWKAREPAGIAYGMGHAVVARNRRLTYEDGTSRMYGHADHPDFRYVEGYEDHSVNALLTYTRDRTLTGMVVNVPCPSQVSEQIYRVSADYWHETREELRQRFGKNLFVLAQCAPAGDLSPHVLIGKRAEQRMWRLKGRDLEQNAPRREIALKIADAISDIVPWAEAEIDWSPAFAYHRETLQLPRRLISEQDVAEALEEAKPFKETYQTLFTELREHPEIREQPRWYTEITKAYRRMERGERVRKRLEIQRQHPTMPIETHALRLGEVAFATNPFELYLDYAIRIRERCKAVQTFLIQKAGCSGTYLPSARSVAHKGYGSVPANTDIGPEGGDQLVEWTVSTLNQMWSR